MTASDRREAAAPATAGLHRPGPRISALVVARNEEARLPACLATLTGADEIVVVLDRSTDASADIARAHDAKLLEGGWGLLIALCAGLFPLLSHLKARLEPERHRQ